METWDNAYYVAFDTETTGFSKEDRICEICIVLAQGSRVLKKFHSLINPGVSIEPGAEAVHGISEYMLKDAPRFEDIKGQVLEFLRLDAPWVAHNMSFDTRMLSYSIPRDEWPRGIPTLCTMDFAKKKHPILSTRRGHKLVEIAGALGFDYDLSGTHNAEYDTNLLVQLMPALMGTRPVELTYTKYSEQWLK
jgi:DNA polymerase-3 subunit epsilon